MLVKILPVFEQMLVLFLMMALGYLAGKTGVLSLEGNKTLSKLVNCITNPCTVLYSALCTEHMMSNRETIEVLGFLLGTYGFLIAVAWFVPKLLRVPAEKDTLYQYMMIFSNVGFMGIPVTEAIFGTEAVFCTSLVVMFFNVLTYTYGLYLIRGGKGEKFRIRNVIAPMTVCSAFGLLCYLLNVRVGGVVEMTMDSVRRVTTPCAMMIIGSALAAVPLREVFRSWRLYAVSALKLLVIPALIYLALRNLIANRTVLGVMVVVMAMPIASNFTMLSAQYDRDQKLAASAVFLTTLLSVLTIPIISALLLP